MNNNHDDKDPEEDEPGGASPFRSEAIDHQNRPALEGRVLQLSPSWPRWAYWILVAACATTVSYTLSARVPEWVSGPAIIETDDRAGFGLVALLPARHRALLRTGMPLFIELEGRGGAQTQVQVESVGSEALTLRSAESLLGRCAEELSEDAGPFVLVRASLPMKERSLPYDDGDRGVAWVAVRSRTIAATLVPTLGAILDDEL